jgi:hypothetical protein
MELSDGDRRLGQRRPHTQGPFGGRFKPVEVDPDLTLIDPERMTWERKRRHLQQDKK